MSESVVDMGMRLLERQRAEAEAATEADDAGHELVEALGAEILGLLNTLLLANADLARQIANVQAQVLASRVRRPVRDELGTILYVIDEVKPPLWAAPMDNETEEY